MIAKWLDEQFLKTIVLFELPNGQGGYNSHGTGVLMLYKGVFFLATCKHIVLKPDNSPYKGLHATINKTDGSASRKDIEGIHSSYGLKWFFHTNPNVDLALCPIAIEQRTEDVKMVGEDMMEDFESIPVGEEVFFLGYPLGLGVQNVPKLSPLVRGGMVALKSSDSTFLLDANVYPGSSGSPVFYKPVLATKEGKDTNLGKLRPIKLLGIVSSNLSAQEEAISKKTGRTRAIFEENAGLGIVQSSTLLLEIFNYPEVHALIPKTQEVQSETEKPADEQKAEEPK